MRPCPAIARRAARLDGVAVVPGDKSVSHRALMLGALAVGRTRVTGLLEGADVLATAQALRHLGVQVARQPDGAWTVDGVGVGGLASPIRSSTCAMPALPRGCCSAFWQAMTCAS